MAEQARLDDRAVREHVVRLEERLGRLEQIPGRTAELALEAIAGLAELYGEALARVGDHAHGTPVAEALGGDELVRHLFVLHDIRPSAVPAGTGAGTSVVGGSRGCGGGCGAVAGTSASQAASTVIPVEALTRSLPGRVSS